MNTSDLQPPSHSKTPLDDLKIMVGRSGYDSATLWSIIERGGVSWLELAEAAGRLSPCDVLNMRRLVRITQSWIVNGEAVSLETLGLTLK